jgi:microcompartment protein CcmL/EutN
VKTVLNADVGMLSVICEGDLAACKAAVDAGKTAADRVGKCLSTNLIGRPDGSLETLSPLTSDPKSPIKKARPKPKPRQQKAARAKVGPKNNPPPLRWTIDLNGKTNKE